MESFHIFTTCCDYYYYSCSCCELQSKWPMMMVFLYPSLAVKA